MVKLGFFIVSDNWDTFWLGRFTCGVCGYLDLGVKIQSLLCSRIELEKIVNR